MISVLVGFLRSQEVVALHVLGDLLDVLTECWLMISSDVA